MATFADLANTLTRFKNAIPKNVNEIGKNFVRDIVVDLARVTPVDTTAAVSNWQVAYRHETTVLPPYVPGYLGYTHTQSAVMTIQEADSIIGLRQIGKPIYIINNIDYINELNAGSSKQEAAGFVMRAIVLGITAKSRYNWVF